MTVNLRDQRARIYAYGDATAESTGYPAPVYTVRDSGAPDQAWWCRIEEPGGREVTVGDMAERQSPMVAAFSDEVVVGLQDVVLLLNADASAGPLFRVSSVNPRRLLREIAVQGIFADKALYNLVD